MRWWLIPDQCLLMKTRDISLFPALPEWTLIRGAHSCSTASLVNVHSAGGTSLEAADSPPAAKFHSGCCDPGHPILALCRRVSHPLLATLWRLLIFQAPLSLTILSQHICAGAFSFRLYLHIKAHFSFPSKNRMVIFLKTQTHAFFYLRSFEDLLCCPDAAFQFLSSLSSFLSCQQIDFFYYSAPFCPVFVDCLSDVQLHSCYFLPDPCCELCGQLAKTMVRLCAPAQQDSCKRHSYSDCEPPSDSSHAEGQTMQFSLQPLLLQPGWH